MDRSKIADGIERLGPWFHKIELPHGLTTKMKSYAGEPDDHPHGTWKHVRKVLPNDLSNKRVLDIGCNGGFYAIAANQRGASVTGVDAKRWHVRQATFAARALDLKNIHFACRSLYELDPMKDGVFDVVLALGLIYHLKHLVRGLEILFDVCSDLLIVETAVLHSPEMPPESDAVGHQLFPLR